MLALDSAPRLSRLFELLALVTLLGGVIVGLLLLFVFVSLLRLVMVLLLLLQTLLLVLPLLLLRLLLLLLLRLLVTPGSSRALRVRAMRNRRGEVQPLRGHARGNGGSGAARRRGGGGREREAERVGLRVGRGGDALLVAEGVHRGLDEGEGGDDGGELLLHLGDVLRNGGELALQGSGEQLQ